MSRGTLRLALDLGTTTLAGRLLHSDGASVAEARVTNPQRAVAADVIRRLEAARQGKGERLQQLLVAGIETLLSELLRQAGASRQQVGAAAVAGNPAMSYLLRGLPVEAILFPPHRPAEHEGLFLAPIDLGIDLPCPLYLFPLVSGYVGGDLVAFLFACPDLEPGTFFLDVGTNGEMALYDGRRWWVTSVAAGPAFEGEGISCGMAVGPGAVSGVRLEGDRLRLTVVGGGAPRGVCGSGLVEAVAAALDGGLIDARGRIVEPLEVPSNLAVCIAEPAGGRALRLYRDATVDLQLTQADVRSFQLAKGALKAGAECLLARAGLAAAELRAAVVTGAFGFSLSPAALKRVALLPATMVDKVRFFPGGALAGVGRFLELADGPQRLRELAAVLRPYPLSGTPHFERNFIHALDFEKTAG